MGGWADGGEAVANHTKKKNTLACLNDNAVLGVRLARKLYTV